MGGAGGAGFPSPATIAGGGRGTVPAGHGGPAGHDWSKDSRHTFSDGADTLASARPQGCSPTWRHGSAEGYVRIFGGNGKTAPTVSRNCGAVVCRSSTRRLPPARRPGSGACQDIRRSNRLCATRISTASVFPDSMLLLKLNPIEPPWYGPVCLVVWEGRRREVSPYPDQYAHNGLLLSRTMGCGFRHRPGKFHRQRNGARQSRIEPPPRGPHSTS